MRIVVLLVALAAMLWAQPSLAHAINVERLQSAVNEKTVVELANLACRNMDKIVHLEVSIDWNHEALEAEQAGFKRLVFWNAQAEYLFPEGSYDYQHGAYLVKGYFIVRSGGLHQGIASIAFEKVDDTKVLLNPDVEEYSFKHKPCH